MDSGYAILFGSDGWQSLCERAADGSINDANDLANRINRYEIFIVDQLTNEKSQVYNILIFQVYKWIWSDNSATNR